MNEDLSRRAIACAVWEWLPGMCATLPGSSDRWTVSLSRADACWVEEVAPAAIPDLCDPATLGCLLWLVREAWEDPEALACGPQSYAGNGAWAVTLSVSGAMQPGRDAEYEKLGVVGRGASEAEALVVALEGAPVRSAS